jgi:exoribonuclease II
LGDNPAMYALFDDAGKFLAGRVMSESDSAAQLELDSGKRVKVKAANVLLKFDKPTPLEFLAQAHQIAQEIELDLVWEFAPEAEFSFADLAGDYFHANPSPVHQAAALLRLFEAPHYFRRAGKGVFKKAPQEMVQAALLGLERKKQVALQIQTWAQELSSGQCPAPVREQLYKILFKPDKNAPEYKAVVEAAQKTQQAPLNLLTAAGAIDSPYQFHWRRFLFENFPKGTAFADLAVPVIKETLALAPGVQAFSIDDSSTTEIDDALSVQGLGSGSVVFGIHIAAPALALEPDSPLDKIARDRLSTVYMPGYKITMLPDAVVQAYTLQAGRDCPCVSLYVTLDEASLAITHTETRIEQVHIAANLRHDQLDATVTEASLTGAAPAAYAFAPELALAFRLARHLKAGREVVRGKPENFNRPDYNFRLDGLDSPEPTGLESVAITTRVRGAPLDLIVAEAMILANSTWGGWLHACGVPGIYRSQASMAPGIKVRMGTKAAPHAGMGVAQYTWATSPLRRYVDLLNQWQIIACARHGLAAALVAPFKPKDAALFSIISSFESAYSAYNTFQSGIERYWTLQYLAQQQVQELTATVMKDGLVRADAWPLVCKAVGADRLPRGAQVSVRITGFDLLTLDAHASVVARLDMPAPDGESALDASAPDDADEALAGPLVLSIDVHAEPDIIPPPVTAI